MSSDERFLVRLLEAAAQSKLKLIIVGSTAAVLQGAPVMTQDVDVLVRDTPANRRKLELFCRAMGAVSATRPSQLSKSVKILGLEVPIDVLFDELPQGPSFASLRSRAVRVALGHRRALVASLADVIAAKERAGRPKDLSQLVVLRETLRVKNAQQG